MPPRKAKKNASTASNEAIAIATDTFPKPDENTHTPEQPPPQKPLAGITQAQKQALIDNLQLEITERARKLRAEYALQPQNLRSRLEGRINRIPIALRQRTMQSLLDEQAAKMPALLAPAVPVTAPKAEVQDTTRLKKRQSDQISTLANDDKENENSTQDLPQPKKRAKTTNTNAANTKATRTVSRKGTVLSPKSYNASAIPRSPVRPTTAALGPPPRSISPVKALPALPPKGGPTRKASKSQLAAAGKTEQASEGRSSDASNTSAGTTIVKKGATARGKTAAAKSVSSAAAKIATASKNAVASAAAVKKENVPPAGGRSLRKRA